MSMKVKVCGITNYRDAAAALDEGVDALGFNFFPSSPRYIEPQNARAIIEKLPPFAVSVGLFVNADAGHVVETAGAAGVQVIQLHGNETPDYCGRLRSWPIIKALRIGSSGGDFGDLGLYSVRAFLLDSKDDVLFGGTGKSFNWTIARKIERLRPVILAGGLRPDNVAEAIRIVAPYAVDVCSGIECAPGTKNIARLKEFMNEVRNASKT